MWRKQTIAYYGYPFARVVAVRSRLRPVVTVELQVRSANGRWRWQLRYVVRQGKMPPRLAQSMLDSYIENPTRFSTRQIERIR